MKLLFIIQNLRTIFLRVLTEDIIYSLCQEIINKKYSFWRIKWLKFEKGHIPAETYYMSAFEQKAYFAFPKNAKKVLIGVRRGIQRRLG